jgi:hypothetical protein
MLKMSDNELHTFVGLPALINMLRDSIIMLSMMAVIRRHLRRIISSGNYD